MSKISKSIVISEFLWLLFFAVVFLKFDYTRTTLAVVNAIVWLCIVLVFSIIILQFLTRQAFTKVRGILLVLIFLIIDQVIKALLYFAPSEISIPETERLWKLASKVFWSQKTAGGDSDESPPFA